MARMSVDKLHASPEPHGRQVIWDIMIEFDGWFSVADVFKPTFIPRRTIRSYLSCLVAGKMAERDENLSPIAYRLIGDRPFDAPRLRTDGSSVKMGLGTENMWRAMRKTQYISATEIAAVSTTSYIKVSEVTAAAYCKALFATGYLRVVQKAVPGQKRAVYRLIRDTGPKPPMIQRVKHVFDQNTSEVFIPERNS